MGVRIARAVACAVVAAAVLTGVAAGASDTQWVAFSGQNGGSGAAQIYRIQLDGSGLQQVTTGNAPATDPSFSPDAKKLVFVRLGDGIFRVNVDGTGLRRLTKGTRDSYPVWSPDGSRIAFIRVVGPAWRLFVVPASGGKAKRLVRAPSSGRPTWSSDSRSIYIPTGGDMAKVDAKTGRVTSYFGALIDPMLAQAATVSPNAKLLAHIGRRTPTGAPDCGESHCPAFALYLSKPKQEKPARVAPDTGPGGWSPDSKQLIYAARGALLVYTTGSGKKMTITTGKVVPAGDAPPAWAPR